MSHLFKGWELLAIIIWMTTMEPKNRSPSVCMCMKVLLVYINVYKSSGNHNIHTTTQIIVLFMEHLPSVTMIGWPINLFVFCLCCLTVYLIPQNAFTDWFSKSWIDVSSGKITCACFVFYKAKWIWMIHKDHYLWHFRKNRPDCKSVKWDCTERLITLNKATQ